MYAHDYEELIFKLTNDDPDLTDLELDFLLIYYSRENLIAKLYPALPNATHLIHLSLEGCSFEHHMQLLISVLSNNKKLQSLQLRNTGIGKYGIQALAAALPQTYLLKLSLASNDISALGACAIAEVLPACKQLESLDLSVNQISTIGIQAILMVLPKCMQLVSLRFCNVGFIVQEHAQLLADILPKCNLQSLVIKSNNIDQAGVDAIPVFLAVGKLQSLDLDCCGRIGELELQALINVLPVSKLKSLNLSNNYIRDKVVKLIAEKLPQCELQSLFLFNDFLNDEGFEIIAAVLPYIKLQDIDLGLNNGTVTDAGVTALQNALLKSYSVKRCIYYKLDQNAILRPRVDQLMKWGAICYFGTSADTQDVKKRFGFTPYEERQQSYQAPSLHFVYKNGNKLCIPSEITTRIAEAYGVRMVKRFTNK